MESLGEFLRDLLDDFVIEFLKDIPMKFLKKYLDQYLSSLVHTYTLPQFCKVTSATLTFRYSFGIYASVTLQKYGIPAIT